MLVGFVRLLELDGSIWIKVMGGATLAVGAIGGYLLLKWLVTIPAQVFVEAEQLVVHFKSRPKTLLIPFIEVAHFKYKSLRDREEFVFKLENGRNIKISSNKLFGPIGDFIGLVQAVENAANKYRQQNPLVLKRSCSFFERPASTVLLGVATIVLLMVFGKLLLGGNASAGSLIGAIGAYISYLGPWLAAADRRKQATS
ncbi:hypothetical protein [Hymenobacter sp. BT730]|uniref:hypothetical protein n=1 Tax=Hymenobacter sp. BT730 TaxID=3063332 RepID=UPI0026DF0F9F|nr:hypothetical protein [Hymenobacter sp. BT730]